MAVTVSRKGAEAVREHLEAQERTIAEQQRQIRDARGLGGALPCTGHGNARPGVPLVAVKDLEASHVTGVGGDSQLVLLPLEYFPAMVNGEREGGPDGSGDSFTG